MPVYQTSNVEAGVQAFFYIILTPSPLETN